MKQIVNAAILKIAGRCNINCTYCYMYNLADQSHQLQPTRMSRQTVNHFFVWLERYLQRTGLKEFRVSLHGGEPLLAGQELVAYVAQRSKEIENTTKSRIRLSLLTNSLLLDENWLQLFKDTGIRFGVSLDGPAEYHDRHRIEHSGKGTHSKVEDQIRWTLSHPIGRKVFSSVLCVLHPDMDGNRLFRYFYDLGLSGVDFLLPDQNHSYSCDTYPAPTNYPTYGRVLADAFQAWREQDDSRFYIRKFGMMMAAVLGETPSLDSLGTGSITVFTVETNGEVEPVDTMKACGDSFTKSGINISQIESIEVNDIPLVRLGLQKTKTLPDRCQSCRNLPLCGGGYLPHRFCSDNQFENPTVYCSDMMYLADQIYNNVISEVNSIKQRASAS